MHNYIIFTNCKLRQHIPTEVGGLT